jgi:cytochrome c biogenesis protein CcmG, thiol:disulfide interchange protein DsbE
MSVARALSVGLLVLSTSGVAHAESDALPPLLKPLDLTAYRAGTVPPSFTGRTLDAREFSLADLRGSVVVLNFWASWCLECRQEMPALDRLHRTLQPRGLTVVGLNARESPAAAQRYAGTLRLSFPLVLDADGRINTLYGVVGLPTTFVIGRDGRAVALAVGIRDWEGAQARALFEALLAEPTPAGGR